jgi:adenylosuccinate lyase
MELNAENCVVILNSMLDALDEIKDDINDMMNEQTDELGVIMEVIPYIERVCLLSQRETLERIIQEKQAEYGKRGVNEAIDRRMSVGTFLGICEGFIENDKVVDLLVKINKAFLPYRESLTAK